jgi:transposase
MNNFIQGSNRNQMVLIPDCLENIISLDNEVRTIDLFVEALPIEEYGFEVKNNKEGRPSYHPKALLKLFIYGYMNSFRSSRKLEKQCEINIEVMWLMNQLVPDHNTISNFRRDNAEGIRKVFKATVSLAKHFELIGGKLLAGDSTKLRAQNSKKNNYNPKKIERHLDYINDKLNQYQQALAEADGDKDKPEIQKEIDKQEGRKEFYNALSETLEATGETQISTSDPESRQITTRNGITEVAYNVQTTVDGQHCIPIDYLVTNQNDSKAMGEMVERATNILETNEFTALYDKGYHTGSEFEKAEQLGVEVMVAIPAVASHAPDIAYDVEHFRYDYQTDEYTCPENQTLSTNGKEYNKDRGASSVKVKHYKTNACLTCPAFERCTKNKKGRLIERSEHAKVIEENKTRIEQNKEIYKRRQAIVEHPYGTIKRQWGFSYIMTKKFKDRASSDVGLMFTAYNLRRIMNLINPEILREYLRVLVSFFSKRIDLFIANLSRYFFPTYFYQNTISLQNPSLESVFTTSHLLKYVK